MKPNQIFAEMTPERCAEIVSEGKAGPGHEISCGPRDVLFSNQGPEPNRCFCARQPIILTAAIASAGRVVLFMKCPPFSFTASGCSTER